MTDIFINGKIKNKITMVITASMENMKYKR